MFKSLVLLNIIIMCNCMEIYYNIDDNVDRTPTPEEILDITDAFKEQTWCLDQTEYDHQDDSDYDGLKELIYIVNCKSNSDDIAKYFIPDKYLNVIFYDESGQFSECSEKIPTKEFNSINFYLHYGECEFDFDSESDVKKGFVRFTFNPYYIYPPTSEIFVVLGVGLGVIISAYVIFVYVCGWKNPCVSHKSTFRPAFNTGSLEDYGSGNSTCRKCNGCGYLEETYMGKMPVPCDIIPGGMCFKCANKGFRYVEQGKTRTIRCGCE